MSSPTDRDHFTEHGWLVLRGAVAPERVAQLEGALDALVPPASYPAWGGRVVEVASLSRISAVLRSHAHEARFAGRVAQLLGTPRVQLLQDTALIKPAASPATVAWHQDYRYFTYLDRPQVVTARLALTRCSEGSGCLRVLDGSHAWGLLGDDLNFRHGSVEDGLQGLGLPHREAARELERVVELEPGDVSLHSCLTFHRSLENRSGAARKTLVVRLMDATCRLLPERLPSPALAAIFTTTAAGHLTGPSFPVLWDAGGELVPAPDE